MRSPRPLSDADVARVAHGLLKPGERIHSVHSFPAIGIGQTVVQAVIGTDDYWRAYVVDEDGRTQETQDFWARERLARLAHFGRMTPDLYERQSTMSSDDSVDVTVMVRADVPEPVLPFDGTDVRVSSDTYQAWFNGNVDFQVPLIRAAKKRVHDLLVAGGIQIMEDPATLPFIRAQVPVALLRSSELNASDIVRIDLTPAPGQLLGYAGEAAMNAGALSGGTCGGLCNGDHIGVGLWERDNSGTITSGIATNNKHIASSVFAYETVPTLCATDADCYVNDPLVTRMCVATRDGNGCRSSADCVKGHTCTNGWCVGPKKCVQDHLTWVAASIGMNLTYDYSSTVPGPGTDPSPNVPSGTAFGPTGAWYVNFKVGNDDNISGLDYLTSTAGGGATPFINHSYSGTPYQIDWAGRAFGTFVTAAAGDDGGLFNVTCSRLRNELCVGMYGYRTYNDLTSHRRTEIPGYGGSNYINDPGVDSTLERPHLLGPGNHAGYSGEHMPNIGVTPGGYEMRFADYSGSGIVGSSFSAPAVLSAAIQAQQYEGWFSSLAYPMVNKAVLLASTQDSNADDSVPVISNDLDLALNCGSIIQTCGGTISSNAVSSEIEMVEKAPCTFQRNCSIEVRIKNGASLQSCGTTTTERVGVAWAFHY